MIWARSVLWAVLAYGPLSASKVRPAVLPLLLTLAPSRSWVISSH